MSNQRVRRFQVADLVLLPGTSNEKATMLLFSAGSAQEFVGFHLEESCM